ncbi:MAG TPA: vWA domain-containing protein [Magnetospirillum sp.]|nr:vWA domain-containing protein [Magnetospirillum sp.]
MIRTTIAALAAASAIFVATVPPAVAADRTPLLMEGKKTLYQRVLSRPGAMLKRQPGDGPGAQQPALTRFYVYSRQNVGGADWIEVGLTAKGKADGWLREDLTLPWKQQLSLAFTNPAGRDRALMFKEQKDLAAIVEADKPEAQVAPLRKAVESGKGDPRVVSEEPATYVDIAKQFYLLPILDAEETFSGMGHRVRMLRIASVSTQDDKSQANAGADKNRPSLLKNFRASVVFVIDSTMSMDPYIDRTRSAVRRIAEQIEKAGLSDRVKFGLVAFRSSVQATPGLEYTSRLYADPSQVKDGKDFQQRVASLKGASVSSARFSEDAYAGVMTAVNQVPWTDFGGRYVVLITDAGALRGGDPLSSTKLDAEQVRLEALHRGLAIYTLHLKTPSGKQNHAEAEAQYKALSTHPLLSAPLYYPVDAGSVDQFGQMVDTLADTIVAQVNAAYRGEEAAGAARTADPNYSKATAKDEGTRIRMDAAMLGHAMQLAYLGRVEGTRAPPLFSAWVTDRDLAKPDVATTEVRVLLTKNQLSDMQQVLQSIAKAGQAAQLSPNDFFAKMRSAAAVLGRDPNAINNPNATKLADLGLMGEYLDGLPYRSKVLDIDQQTWSSWSISQQQAFLDEVNRKLRLYQIYHDDVDRWVALDGGADPGEAVYPVPLDALP